VTCASTAARSAVVAPAPPIAAGKAMANTPRSARLCQRSAAPSVSSSPVCSWLRTTSMVPARLAHSRIEDWSASCSSVIAIGNLPSFAAGTQN
jgi:hypothetical protein